MFALHGFMHTAEELDTLADTLPDRPCSCLDRLAENTELEKFGRVQLGQHLAFSYSDVQGLHQLSISSPFLCLNGLGALYIRCKASPIRSTFRFGIRDGGFLFAHLQSHTSSWPIPRIK